jgi:hypothetical protein
VPAFIMELQGYIERDTLNINRMICSF